MPDYYVMIEGCSPVPVRAANSAAARNWLVRNKVKVEQLTTEHAIECGVRGVALVVAGEDTEDPAPEEKGETQQGDAGQGDGKVDENPGGDTPADPDVKASRKKAD
jgi:hypothetical protein